jgi:hypothetical protein
VAPYLCSGFHIFDRPILEKYDFQVEGGPHLFQSCLRAAQNGFLPTTKDMHIFLESGSYQRLSLHAYLMDIHHDTSFKSIQK